MENAATLGPKDDHITNKDDSITNKDGDNYLEKGDILTEQKETGDPTTSTLLREDEDRETNLPAADKPLKKDNKAGKL